MNREQKAVTAVSIVLILVIVGLLAGTYYMWRKSQVPALPEALQGAARGTLATAVAGFTSARLYYFSPECDCLVRQSVDLPLEQRPENTPELVRLAWEQLRQAPVGPQTVSALPQGSEIELQFNLFLAGRPCTADRKKGLLPSGGHDNGEQALEPSGQRPSQEVIFLESCPAAQTSAQQLRNQHGPGCGPEVKVQIVCLRAKRPGVNRAISGIQAGFPHRPAEGLIGFSRDVRHPAIT